MQYTVYMLLGILLGRYLLPAKWTKKNQRLQLFFTVLLLGSMGFSLGQMPDFWGRLTSLGWVSLLYATVPLIASVVLVWLLQRLGILPKKERDE